jgi:hypothetical protein
VELVRGLDGIGLCTVCARLLEAGRLGQENVPHVGTSEAVEGYRLTQRHCASYTDVGK